MAGPLNRTFASQSILRKMAWPRGRVASTPKSRAEKYIEAREKGDFEIAGVIAGEAVDLIADIPPAAEIVDRIVNQATILLTSASNRYQIAQ
jgi:hypothetical protein